LLVKNWQWWYNSGTIFVIVKKKDGYYVLSKKTKRNLGGPASTNANLDGPYKTRDEAVKRLRQVEFFKH